MKKMSCSELGGACDKVFYAKSFEDISKQSQEHGKEMFKIGDKSHIEAMGKMQELMKDPKAMNKWLEDKRILFESLPDI